MAGQGTGKGEAIVIKEEALALLDRVSKRLWEEAQDLKLRATISEHKRSGVIAFLVNEHQLMEEALKVLGEKS